MADAVKQALLLSNDMTKLRTLRTHEVFLGLKRDLAKTFLIFLAASEVQQLLFLLLLFLFLSSCFLLLPFLHGSLLSLTKTFLTLSKGEITGLRLKFQLQIVRGKKSKLHLFISTSLTSILIL